MCAAPLYYVRDLYAEVPMRSRGLAEVSEQTTVEQVGERRLERVNQPDESRRPGLPLHALNAAHLDRRKPGLVGQVFLRPASRKAQAAYVLTKSFKWCRRHPRHRPPV